MRAITSGRIVGTGPDGRARSGSHATLLLGAAILVAITSVMATPRSAAAASTITMSGGGELTFAASPGVANNLTISVSGGVYTFHDTADSITLGDGTTGCVSVTATSVTCPDSAVASLVFNLGDQVNEVNVRSINRPTTINGGDAIDQIFVGNANRSLDDILGALTVNGEGGTNYLTLKEQGETEPHTYTVTSIAVSRQGGPSISYSTAIVVLEAGTGGDTINPESIARDSGALIKGGDGNDTFNIGNASGSLDDLLQSVRVSGEAGSDTLLVNDQGDQDSNFYGIPDVDLGAQATAVLTIADDDPAPVVSIGDVTVVEGNGGTTSANFSARLTPASAQAVTVQYATADGTASGGSDYTATTGMLTFNPGETSQTITVAVIGDTAIESNETFVVNLSSPANATIAGGRGTGTIFNDDEAPTQPQPQPPPSTEPQPQPPSSTTPPTEPPPSTTPPTQPPPSTTPRPSPHRRRHAPCPG